MTAEDQFNFQGIFLQVKGIRDEIAAGSFGANQTQVQSAIEAATNLDGLEGSLATLEGYLDGVETTLANIRDRLPVDTARSPYGSFDATNSAAIKASAGTLFSIVGSHTATAIRYLQLFNRTTAATNGLTPLLSYPMPAVTTLARGGFVLDTTTLTDKGLDFSTGITWAFSSTSATLTLDGSNSITVNAIYV